MTPVGLTKDAGWNIGVSKTLPYSVPELWEFVTSPAGIALWLGEGVELVTGAEYETADGTRGEVRSRRERDRVRLTWHPADWSYESTVQVAVVAAGAKSVLRFHQERLMSSDDRERQRAHWQQVMAAVVARLADDRG
ncbi:activator of Hsp90 ATPase-like protein [Kribbella amoyensis]|uniref:Activator of Hsp90 ATPase-like protein n=1 Tax=Kribbella amoyensis TaxID=996641 RepID=A0A561BXK5_9ACTN|nr:SRPBCC domain-containing protein [Kribbella amoyensis]TWD83626.1 activator of Hsp90 ATPase-like protein [Kribbella amoyensis]